MKRILFILFLAVTAFAAKAEGEGWYKYPVYCDSINDVIEASNKVYYLSGGNLFSFSPDDQEGYYYSSSNKLNDVDINNIYYNYDKKYLLITYANSNIDVLYDNGKVVNLPDIRDANTTADKGINDVAFGDDRIAIATNFGIVIYDDKRMEVKESGIYDLPISNVAIKGGRLFIYYRNEQAQRYVYYSPLDARHNKLDKFIALGWGAYTCQIVPLADDLLLLKNPDSGELLVKRNNYDNNTWATVGDQKYKSHSTIRQYKEGFYTKVDEGMLLISPDASMQVNTLPEVVEKQKLAFHANPNKVWGGDPKGVAYYDISGGKVTVLYDKIIYADAITCGRVGYMRWSPDGKRLYISNLVMSIYKSIAQGECYDAYQTTNIIENGYPRDVSLMKASADHVMSIKHQQEDNSTRMFGDPGWIIEDPDNPDIYYCPNNHEGLYVIKRNATTGEYEEIGKFDSTNSPVPLTWGSRVQDVNIDKEGNLWIGYQEGAVMSVLPAAKRKKDPSTIQASDWKEESKLANYGITQKDQMSVFCKQSNMAFVFTAKHQIGFVAIDTKGTYANTNDDVLYHWTMFTDQDGNTFSAPTRMTFALEDNRGAVWFGTTAGIFEITNPANATNPSMTVRRIKVPRNDGTSYADYLLESEIINWMCLDPAGRKWIATENSGIFLVSAEGDKILRNYTMDNSPLPSNSVACIECDPTNNTVYVGTASGLYSFLSDATPPQESYSDIYAYPNPVRPEYTGEVKITGLMDNSIVKITDSYGNAVYQTRSEGGMATWNVCNYSGDRVKSGVYYIYASSNNGKSKGAVTKIMVIN